MEFSKTIETERLILRKVAFDDANDIFNNYASRDKVTEFLSWQSHKSIEDTILYLNNVVLPAYNDETYRWAIEYKEDGKMIGCIDIVKFDKRVKMAELGYVLSDDYWGLGIMPEAGKAVIEYLKELDFKRIQAIHYTGNPKSGRVMQKLGMQFEGILRKSHLNNKGEIIDVAMYSLIID